MFCFSHPDCHSVISLLQVTTTHIAPQIIKGALDGIITSLVVPVTTALTLGSVGKTNFHRKHAQLNIMVKNLGVSLSAIILGSVAWAIYPDIVDVFYQFIAVGVLCLVCVLIMPGKETVDHNVARGQSVRGGKDHWRHRYVLLKSSIQQWCITILYRNLTPLLFLRAILYV